MIKRLEKAVAQIENDIKELIANFIHAAKLQPINT
jgi:hypothetical protein